MVGKETQGIQLERRGVRKDYNLPSDDIEFVTGLNAEVSPLLIIANFRRVYRSILMSSKHHKNIAPYM